MNYEINVAGTGAFTLKAGRKTSRWWRCFRGAASPSQRIICLPHAGGSASFFRNWAELLPESVELLAVQYPGHEDRYSEPFVSDIGSLVGALADEMITCGITDIPYLIFGHSMGGYIAWELALELRKRGAQLPYRLVVSACEAPSMRAPGNWHSAGDEKLIEEINRLFTHRQPVAPGSEIAGLILPVIRNDYRLIETWKPSTGRQPLRTAITAFYAEDDSEMCRRQALAWELETSGEFRCRSWNGGHFYLIEHRQEVVESLMEMARAEICRSMQKIMLP